MCDLKNLTMAVDGKLLFENFSFSLAPGARVGVVGGNGTGKTTLFRIIAGELKPLKGTVSMGCVRRRERRCLRLMCALTPSLRSTVSLGIVSQSRDTLDPDKTVYQEISQGADEMEVRGARRGGAAAAQTLTRACLMHADQRRAHQPAGVHGGLQPAGRCAGEEGGRPLRRRAKPRASGQDAAAGSECAAAGRAHQRLGCAKSMSSSLGPNPSPAQA